MIGTAEFDSNADSDIYKKPNATSIGKIQNTLTQRTTQTRPKLFGRSSPNSFATLKSSPYRFNSPEDSNQVTLA